MSAVENEEFVVKYPLEKGVRVVVIEDGNVVKNVKLEPFHSYTITTQNDKAIDIVNTVRERLR